MKIHFAVFFASSIVLLSGNLSRAETPAADVALLTVFQGEVNFQSKDGTVRPVVAYMRIRHGDTLRLQQRSIVRLTFTSAPRQEIWTGPVSFVATLSGGEVLSGRKAVVIPLPPNVPQRLARVSELMSMSHMGGSVVRSVKPRVPVSKEDLAAAMGVYETMRANTTITDVTPELYLYSIFLDNEMFDDMKIVAKDMLIRQPDNRDIQQLVKTTLTPTQ